MFNNIKTGIVTSILLGIILAFLVTFAILPLSNEIDQMNHFESLLSLSAIVGFGFVSIGLQSHFLPKQSSTLAIMAMSVTFLIVSLLLRLIN